MITIAETSEYRKQAEKQLPLEERTAIISYLAQHPCGGEIMEGTGGIRKLRWAKPGKGKSGGVRIIYYYHNNDMPLYLITLFSKNQKVNLSQKEKNVLRNYIRELVKANGRRLQ
jgi:hypothetical protein